MSDKEELELKVKAIAKDCTHLTELKKALEHEGIETYSRGKQALTGAYLGKRRYRLTTLGVTKEHFKAMSKEEERLREIRKRKDDKNRGYEKDR